MKIGSFHDKIFFTGLKGWLDDKEKRMQERLNKYLGRMGLASRREADRLIAGGRVTVNGKTASLGDKIDPENDFVCCAGQPLGGRNGVPLLHAPTPVVLAANKPRGIVCTTSPKDRAKTIVELIGYPQRVYPVGRLDKESQGLILMTNRGELVNEILKGSNHHEKEYIVEVNQPVTLTFLKEMSAGVYLEGLDVKTRPCQIERMGKKRVRIVLTQGLNRQIRRMCEACGYQVVSLKRIRIMNILLGDLKEGAYRPLTDEEMEGLLQLLGRESGQG